MTKQSWWRQKMGGFFASEKTVNSYLMPKARNVAVSRWRGERGDPFSSSPAGREKWTTGTPTYLNNYCWITLVKREGKRNVQS